MRNYTVEIIENLVRLRRRNLGRRLVEEGGEFVAVKGDVRHGAVVIFELSDDFCERDAEVWANAPHAVVACFPGEVEHGAEKW